MADQYYIPADPAAPGAYPPPPGVCPPPPPGAYPPPPPRPRPIPTDEQSVDMIAAAEAKIATVLSDFLEDILEDISRIKDLEEQAELVRVILCAFAIKEKAMAAVLNALASKILADKGCCPNGGCDC